MSLITTDSSGLGMKNGSGLRIGISGPVANTFISGRALIRERYMIQTFLHFGEQGNHLSLGVNYRLNGKLNHNN